MIGFISNIEVQVFHMIVFYKTTAFIFFGREGGLFFCLLFCYFVVFLSELIINLSSQFWRQSRVLLVNCLIRLLINSFLFKSSMYYFTAFYCDGGRSR